MNAEPVSPAILELARILAREAVRQYLEELTKPEKDTHKENNLAQ